MSDSDPTLPDPPSGTPPPPAPPIVPMSDPPTVPTTLTPALDATADPSLDPTVATAAEGDLAATTQMPVAPVSDPTLVGIAAIVPPPIDPPLDPDHVGDDATPWYKKPGPLAAVILAVLILAGIIGWLVFGGGGGSDDTASATASRLVLETTDQTGAAIERGFLVSVVGPASAPTSYTWLRPAEVVPGQTAIASSGPNGRAMFDWEVDDTVADPTTWAATVTVAEGLEPGRLAPGPVVDCVLSRPDAQDSTVSMNVAVDSPDASIQRTATYTFPNHQFLPGDSVTCKLVSTSPSTATTVVETTVVATTEATTTTTVPATTVPETTLPATTVPASTTTTSIDIPPPAAGQTVWDLIDNAPSLTEFRQFVIDAGFQPALEKPGATFTIFAPTNEAIAAARAALESSTVPVSSQDLSNLLLAHTNNTGIIQLADLLKMPNIAVLFGGPQKVTADPPTVGGANIYVQVPPASNGVLYLIDRVLTPQP